MQENNSPLVASVSMDDVSYLIKGKSRQEQFTILEAYFWFTYTFVKGHEETVCVTNSDGKQGIFIMNKGFVKFPQTHGNDNPFFVDDVAGIIVVVWSRDPKKNITTEAIHIKIGKKIYSWILENGIIFQPITLDGTWKMRSFDSYEAANEWIKNFIKKKLVKEKVEEILLSTTLPSYMDVHHKDMPPTVQ